MGYHEISVISTPTNNHGVSYEAPVNEKSGGGNARPPEYAPTEFSVVIACSHGKVLAIDSRNGATLWRFDCPGGGYNLPSVIAEKDIVFVGAGRMVYALNPKNGHVSWQTKATDGLIGSGWLTMATVWGSRQAEM
jgi:outer membrane protein assembly factor BamB